MGQQQLLLLVVGAIAVGIAIVLCIDLFSGNSFDSNKNAVAADIMNIAALAQQYYKTPSDMGGGNNSFTGFSIPKNFASTANGTYSAVISSQSLTVTGIGVVLDANGKNFTAASTVTPNSISPLNSEEADKKDDNKDKEKDKDKDKDKEKDKDRDKENEQHDG